MLFFWRKISYILYSALNCKYMHVAQIESNLRFQNGNHIPQNSIHSNWTVDLIIGRGITADCRHFRFTINAKSKDSKLQNNLSIRSVATILVYTYKRLKMEERVLITKRKNAKHHLCSKKQVKLLSLFARVSPLQNRIVQEVLLMVLKPIFEPRFTQKSYAFRPSTILDEESNWSH